MSTGVSLSQVVISQSIAANVKLMGVTPSPGYRDRFNSSPPLSLSSIDALRLEIADAARQRLISQLVTEAQQVVPAAGVATPSDAEANHTYERFKLVVPRENSVCIADILNGAWKAYRDPQLWQDNPQIADKRDLVLKELVLKNLELFEIEQIVKESP
jgi:hypothetical protein